VKKLGNDDKGTRRFDNIKSNFVIVMFASFVLYLCIVFVTEA